MLHLKRILDRAVKRWGFEFGLVAGGAFLGLLIVAVIGFVERPSPLPSAPTVAAPQPSSPAPKQSDPVKAAKSIAPRDPPNSDPNPAPPSGAREPENPAPAWRRFAAIHGPVLGRPMIAVIMDDMGLDRQRSARAIQLPGPLTMSFLTYARSLKGQAAAARDAGHEIMIHVPMEAEDTNAYAGPKAIKSDLSGKELARRLDWVLGRLEKYVGINNHMGSRFTTHAPGMALVLAELKRRGLLFVDSRTSPDTVGAEVASRLSVPFAARDIFLDNDPSRRSVARQLMALEQAAAQKGYAIAIGHPYDSTLGALENWLPTLVSRGFILVPVSAIVRHGQKTKGG